MNDNINQSPKRLAVKLSNTAERLVKQGHPWIFSDSITKINKEGTTGDLAILFDVRNNQPYAIGLYDANSPIRIKVISFGKAAIDTNFFNENIKKAYKIRQPLLKTNTNSYRLIYGENDSFPSLIADVYNRVLVIKLYSGIWFPYFEMIYPHLLSISKTNILVLRLSRNLIRGATPGFSDGMIIQGTLDDETIPFVEHGVHFSANVIKGHKTGYFLDHRHNRKRVGQLARGKSVLDIFSYAGGFSVHALVGGATEVTSLDVSRQALELAQKNAKLNSHTGIHTILEGDAFEKMQTLIHQKKTFDLVIVDPPSFAKRASEIDIALKSYKRLTRLAVQLVSKKGILLMASCSSRISVIQFFETVEGVLSTSKRSWKQFDQTFHDIDHPVSFPEGAYLKCGYYRLGD